MELHTVVQQYRKNYCRIFENIYPSKHSTGFTERNLSVNFARAYESFYPDAVTWYECQFGEKNNLHYDAIIINPEQKEIVVIEAKRFSQLPQKIRQVEADIKRVDNFVNLYFDEFSERIPRLMEYSITGVILADVWTETPSKKAIRSSFENASFVHDYFGNSDVVKTVGIDRCRYFCLDFAGVNVSTVKTNNTIPTDYYLLGIVWNVG